MSEKLIVALSADIQDLKKELAKANGVLEDWAKGTERKTKQGEKGFDNLTTSVKNLVGAYVSLQAAQTLLVNSFNTSLKLDAIAQSFAAVFGSAEEGERQFDRLKRKADEFGLSILSLADSYKQFSASSNLSINETNRIFDSVAKAGSVLKLSEEQVSRALTAMAQMMSKGSVQSEELKQQLGEALPSAFKLAAKAMGVTTIELNKMLDNGQVMASDLLPKLATELDKAFGGKVQGDVKGLQSEWNKLKNSFVSLTEVTRIGKAWEGLLSAINVTVKGATYRLRELFDATGLVAETLRKEVDKVNTPKGINELILKLRDTQQTLVVGTDEWSAYTNAIIEAGKKIDNFKSKEVNVPTPKVKSLSQKMDFKMPSLDTQFESAVNVDLTALAPTQADINAFTEYNALLKKASEYGLIFNSGVDLSKEKLVELNTNAMALVNTLGGALTSAFDAALISGENFGVVLLKAIGDLIKKMLAAVATAAILSAILSSFGIGAVALGGASGSSLFGTILKGLTGFGGTGTPSGNRVASPVVNQGVAGNVAFEIRGDKLYGVLQNYQGRLDRLT